jgi:hypothetical protein
MAFDLGKIINGIGSVAGTIGKIIPAVSPIVEGISSLFGGGKKQPDKPTSAQHVAAPAPQQPSQPSYGTGNYPMAPYTGGGQPSMGGRGSSVPSYQMMPYQSGQMAQVSPAPFLPGQGGSYMQKQPRMGQGNLGNFVNQGLDAGQRFGRNIGKGRDAWQRGDYVGAIGKWMRGGGKFLGRMDNAWGAYRG